MVIAKRRKTRKRKTRERKPRGSDQSKSDESGGGKLQELEEEYDELREGLQIDRNDLDQELIRQPALFERAGRLKAEAVNLRDSRREKQKREDAELDQRIRNEKDEAGEKYTEAVISAAIEMHDRHKAARNAYHAAKAFAAKSDTLQESYQQRAYVLKDLVSLFVAGYWGEVSAGSEQVGAKQRDYDKRRNKMAKKRSSD